MKLEVEELPQVRSRIFADRIQCMRRPVQSQGTENSLSPLSIAWVDQADPRLPGFRSWHAKGFHTFGVLMT